MAWLDISRNMTFGEMPVWNCVSKGLQLSRYCDKLLFYVICVRADGLGGTEVLRVLNFYYYIYIYEPCGSEFSGKFDYHC